ncbi:hypothetical protein VE03_01153 [Pseudogymnoascus sp. 23342-1-I1]|nr:hypothetical protein VE03_01153 [Pseudogymnoascus sp. 23342-1-I1]
MTATLELDSGEHITYESVCTKDTNIINEASYPIARRQLFKQLWDQRAAIEEIVRHQLGLRDEDSCVTGDQWIRGSFNLTGCAIDGITDENLAKFEIVYKEFLDIFEEEEVKMTLTTDPPMMTGIMRDG